MGVDKTILPFLSQACLRCFLFGRVFGFKQDGRLSCCQQKDQKAPWKTRRWKGYSADWQLAGAIPDSKGGNHQCRSFQKKSGFVKLPSLKLTFFCTWKIGGWMNFLFGGWPIFTGELLVSRSVSVFDRIGLVWLYIYVYLIDINLNIIDILSSYWRQVFLRLDIQVIKRNILDFWEWPQPTMYLMLCD